MCRRNKGQSRRRRLICSRRRACSEEFKLTTIGEGTAVSGATLGGFALSGVAKEVCRGPYQFLPSVRPMPWFDLGMEVRWLPRATPELNAMDHLWKHVKANVLANQPTRSMDQSAEAACQYILGLSRPERLRKAGILSGRFWLAKLSKDF